MSGPLPGWTVHLLTEQEVRARYPHLVDMVDTDEGYFNEVPANGNAHWVDYLPEMVLVVLDADGKVVTASNASAWWMAEHGADVPEGVTQ